MIFESEIIILKDGRQCLLRPPLQSDAQQMMEYRLKQAGETDFLLNYPEDLRNYTMEQQIGFIDSIINSPQNFMIVAEIDGRLAGSCQISFNSRIKVKHRAGIGIALLQEYWGLGIGSAMFRKMISIAEKNSEVSILELEVAQGNDRAIALYKKFGFEIVAQRPDAFRLKDGRIIDEIFMAKKIR